MSCEKSSAPIRIANSAAVMRAVSTAQSRKSRQVILPRQSENANAPEAPTPAASVAVKAPK